MDVLVLYVMLVRDRHMDKRDRHWNHDVEFTYNLSQTKRPKRWRDTNITDIIGKSLFTMRSLETSEKSKRYVANIFLQSGFHQENDFRTRIVKSCASSISFCVRSGFFLMVAAFCRTDVVKVTFAKQCLIMMCSSVTRSSSLFFFGPYARGVAGCARRQKHQDGTKHVTRALNKLRVCSSGHLVMKNTWISSIEWSLSVGRRIPSTNGRTLWWERVVAQYLALVTFGSTISISVTRSSS